MTAESVPLTPIAVIFVEFTALKAYSKKEKDEWMYEKRGTQKHTNLIYTTFRGEDGNMSIKTSTASTGHVLA